MQTKENSTKGKTAKLSILANAEEVVRIFDQQSVAKALKVICGWKPDVWSF